MVAAAPAPGLWTPPWRRSAPGATRRRRSTAWPLTLGVRKQTILYHFPSKEALLDAVIDEAGAELIAVLEKAMSGSGEGWSRIDAVVRSVFRLAGRRPELLGLLREVSRLGPPSATRFREMLGPFIERATKFLEEGMAAGEFRRQDARLLLLATYSTVIGVATEVEVLRALGIEPSVRSLVRRRAELLAFLRSALLPGGAAAGLRLTAGELGRPQAQRRARLALAGCSAGWLAARSGSSLSRRPRGGRRHQPLRSRPEPAPFAGVDPDRPARVRAVAALRWR